MTVIKSTVPKLIWAIMAYFFAGLLLPNILLSLTGQMPLISITANVLLPAGILLLLGSLFRRPSTMIFAAFPLTFFAAFQLVLLSLYGRGTIAVDMLLNLVTTNSSEAMELLGNMLPAICGVVVLYIPPLLATIWLIKRNVTFSKNATHRLRLIGGTVALTGAVMLNIAVQKCGFRSLDDLYPLNVAYNIDQAVKRTALTENYAQSSKAFSFDAHSTHPKDVREIYLLIIGETSRAEQWQLYGYQRNTNPRLSSRNDLIVARDVLSESNTTHKSVPMLLSEVDAMDFDSIYHIKGIITAFKEAGFSTAFFSNQQPNHSFIDFFGFEADNAKFIHSEGEHSPDARLIGYLDDELAKKHTKQLIVLHTYGSHFNYRDRYEEADRKFTPDDYPEAGVNYRQRLINAYDNTIVATDRFLDQAITRLEAIDGAQCAMLYTSDHGEDIYDDSRQLFLHASPIPSAHQLRVPLVAWLSPHYRVAHQLEAMALRRNARTQAISSSRSFFHTALTLAGIKTAHRQDQASLASPAYQARKYVYLTDHNTPTTNVETVIPGKPLPRSVAEL